MQMTEGIPADLRSLSEISRELNVPYSTLQYWKKQGMLKTWRRGTREVLASVAQVERLRRESTEIRPNE